MRGLVDTGGERTSFGAAWIAQVTRDTERRRAAAWRSAIDVEDYYRNLPESELELRREWEAEIGLEPAMLEPSNG
jgi:hypothetical protein